MFHFAENLSILRRKAGYTQESLAEALGVSRQAVGKWESGQGLPEAATLVTLAELLGCSLDQLMRETLAEDGLTPISLPETHEDPEYLWGIWMGHMRQFALMIAGLAMTLGSVRAHGGVTK